MKDEIIDLIIEASNSTGTFDTPSAIIENALWFYMSSIVGLKRPYLAYDDKQIPLNYLGITIAGSGTGKTNALKNIKTLFDINEEKWCNEITKSYLELNPMGLEAFKGVDMVEFLPSSLFMNIEGTKEGLGIRCKAIVNAHSGSLNLLNEEILDIIMESSMNSLKEISEGSFNSKIIKGEPSENITGIWANMLLFGSPIALRKDARIYNKFNSELGTGIYRRSFIYYQEPQKMEIKLTEPIPLSIDSLKKWLTDSNHNQVIELDKKAKKRLIEIKEKLIDFANDNIFDDKFSAEFGCLDKIVKLAGLHSILYGTTQIEDKSLCYAYDFYLRCRNTISSLFGTDPEHTRFYKIIKKKQNITKSELFEIEIFDNKNFNDNINMLEELAYRNNEVLFISGSKVKRYSIKPLPDNDLSKLIIGVGLDGKKEKTKNFMQLELPFKDGDKSLYKLVSTKDRDCFTTVWFDGTRCISNAIEGQNICAFDIDGGLSLEEMKRIISSFTYIIYTTKSHSEEKNRFRVLLPTKHKFYVNNQQHSQMISNLADALQIPIYDISTRNIDRLWFVNPNAEVFINEGELVEILPFIPETVLSEELIKQSSNLDGEIPEDEAGKRLYGMKKYMLRVTSSGNRNSNLYKFGMFCKDLGIDCGSQMKELNQMFSEPLPMREMNALVRSVESGKR